MRKCLNCGQTPQETPFYRDGRVVSDGLRSRCRECSRSGGRPGPDPIHPLDRVEEGPGGCWLWTGAVGAHGYGTVKSSGRTRQAHRVVYEYLIGEIPPGLHLDHLCSVKRCVNPWHLDPVTASVNAQRSWDQRRAS